MKCVLKAPRVASKPSLLRSDSPQTTLVAHSSDAWWVTFLTSSNSVFMGNNCKLDIQAVSMRHNCNLVTIKISPLLATFCFIHRLIISKASCKAAISNMDIWSRPPCNIADCFVMNNIFSTFLYQTILITPLIILIKNAADTCKINSSKFFILTLSTGIR